MRYDPLSPKERSERMSGIRSIDTKPEMTVRRLVHSMGYRYKLHERKLAGSPDLVFVSRRKIIFVHGCFWHQHGCNYYRMPKTRTDFWDSKLSANKNRDKESMNQLEKDGWNVMVLWECQIRDIENLREMLSRFLGES